MPCDLVRPAPIAAPELFLGVPVAADGRRRVRARKHDLDRVRLGEPRKRPVEGYAHARGTDGLVRALVERFDIDHYSDFSLISQPNDQTLEGSFSSLSTPNFARKYSLESSWRDLHDII